MPTEEASARTLMVIVSIIGLVFADYHGNFVFQCRASKIQHSRTS